MAKDTTVPKWTKKAHAAVVAAHPELEGKTESVALAVHALAINRDLTREDWREISDANGLRVAGRAIGSAREILGMTPLMKAKAKPKRGPGRPKGSKNKRPAKAVRASRKDVSGSSSVDDLIRQIQAVEDERDSAVSVLSKIRDVLATA